MNEIRWTMNKKEIIKLISKNKSKYNTNLFFLSIYFFAIIGLYMMNTSNAIENMVDYLFFLFLWAMWTTAAMFIFCFTTFIIAIIDVREKIQRKNSSNNKYNQLLECERNTFNNVIVCFHPEKMEICLMNKKYFIPYSHVLRFQLKVNYIKIHFKNGKSIEIPRQYYNISSRHIKEWNKFLEKATVSDMKKRNINNVSSVLRAIDYTYQKIANFSLLLICGSIFYSFCTYSNLELLIGVVMCLLFFIAKRCYIRKWKILLQKEFVTG